MWKKTQKSAAVARNKAAQRSSVILPSCTPRWPEAKMRRRVGGSAVDELRSVGVGDVEHGADEGRILLAVLVHGDDPVASGRRHACKGRGVLTEVAREPDRPDPVVLALKLADDLVAASWTAVPDQKDLGDTV